MSDYVREGTCGTCEYYEFAGNNSKGYCNWYKAYYYDDDSCSHYSKSTSYGGSGSSGGCFLTTACCAYKGLPDDCYELETMRKFRDGYIKSRPYGDELIETYYNDAPAIVEAINASDMRDEVLEEIYGDIKEIIALIESEANDDAVIRYMMLLYKCRTWADAQ